MKGTMAGVYDDEALRFVDDIPGRASAETERMRVRFGQIGAELRKHPNRWAEVAEHDTHVASTGLIRRIRETLKWSTDEWEIVSRRVDGGKYRMYIRYVGPTSPPRPPEPPPLPARSGRASAKPDPAAALAMCCCEHTKRRHLEHDGFCQAAGCDCEGYIAKEVQS